MGRNGTLGNTGNALNSAVEIVDLDRERIRRGRSDERWVPQKAVMEHFGVSRTTLWRWLNDPAYMRGGRSCPCRRLHGGAPRLQLESVDLWLSEPATPAA